MTLLQNDLEEPACELNADVARTLDALKFAGASHMRMSGSGTSCYALCRTARHAQAIAGRVRHRTNGTVYTVDSRA